MRTSASSSSGLGVRVDRTATAVQVADVSEGAYQGFPARRLPASRKTKAHLPKGRWASFCGLLFRP